MKKDVATDRLIRLLIADFRYQQAVDEAIWLDHARRENGRVIFHQDGLVSSIEHSEFAYIEPHEEARFNDFMRYIKPASRKERLLDWADPLLSLGCGIVLLVAGYAVVSGLLMVGRWAWSAISG